MKSKTTLLILILLSVYFCSAQNPNISPKGGEFVFNPEKLECVSDTQRQVIETTIRANIAMLKKQKRLVYSEQKSGNHPLFIWPLQKSATSTYNEIYGVSGYIDHNTSFPNQLTDYNCGTRAYDTNSGYNHQGIDYFTWPFGWKLLDNDEVEIIAAAPGQIVAKNDGEFDRSCDFNNNTWNAIYVQHSDGSISFYGHMKNGSLSTKNVGDTVVEGEYLGVVGSSGNSTGPHLHFETFTDNSFTQLVDPYSGACNSMNTDSWWQTQRPYNNPGINAVLTHSAPPEFPTCPTTEITNESDAFDTNDVVHCAIYLRDQTNASTIDLKLIRPDNSFVYDWSPTLNNDYYASYYYWSFSTVFDMNGEWKWEATYNGETVSHSFNITGALSIEEESLEETSIYPNPFNDIVNINSKVKIKKVNVLDILGKTILVVNKNSDEGIKELDLGQLSNGMYFATLEGEQNQKKTIKLIKK